MRLSPAQLKSRAEVFRQKASACALCPWACGVDRVTGARGVCGGEGRVKVALHGLHIGEEPPISGTRGSGTVFFSHCPMRCVFCQNHAISHGGLGREKSIEDLAAIFLELQKQGAHNINLVTAGHFLPWVVEALSMAAAQGLDLPVVYNSGGYESAEAIDLLDGVVDVYLPDMKYVDNALATRLSGVGDYVQKAEISLQRMFAQAGPLRVDDDGIAVHGTLVRHLVLPGAVENSVGVLRFLAEELPGAPVSVMAQYLPRHRADSFDQINRRLTEAEYDLVKAAVDDLGLDGYLQELDSATEELIPDFAFGRMSRV